jgi:hypothetical protein
MTTKTMKFDQLDASDPDNGRIVNETSVPVAADGEAVSFTLPGGAVWSCDQDALVELLGRGAAPATPTIPLDRAKTIADTAVAAGLAEAPAADTDAYTRSAVLRAKLADLGVDKLAALDPDQADAIEAFIAEEAASQ